MKWFIVVILLHADDYPLYAFTEPTFESREECLDSIVNPDHIPRYVAKLISEYGYMPALEGINCVNEDIFNQLYMQDAV